MIDYVSVDTTTGYVHVVWEPSPSEDIDRYIIYYVEVIGGDSAGYIQGEVGKDTLEYLWATSTAGEGATTMTVASTREGFDPSPLAPFHTTTFLAIRYDSCEKKMELNWTPYQGWGDDLVRYDVYASVDNGAYGLIDQTDNDVHHTVHSNIADNRRYCYFVKAIRNDGNGSFSNVACKLVRHPLHPSWIDAEQASAIGSDQISLKFYIEESGEVTTFQLFRATGPGKPFIEHEIFTDVDGPVLSYTDNVVSTDKQYLYKLYSLDVCYNPVIASNITGNILLQANAVALQAFLAWTPYTDYEAGVKSYHIYRITNVGEHQLIYVVNAPDTSFIDNLDFITGSDIEDEIYYYVIAEENDWITHGDKGFSESNVSCITVTPKILMPNAFTPNDDGNNDIIKPLLTFIPEKYVFQVFDRWGAKIFETMNPDEGWDGSVSGKGKATEGAYIYYILLTTTRGIEVEQRGEITVFYP